MSPNIRTTCGDSSSLSFSPSLRLSCDRCRVQKLKCSVPAGSQACHRCMRASVSCVFSRRNLPKRTNKRLNQTLTTTPTSTHPPSPRSPIQPAPVTPAHSTPPPTSGLVAAATSTITCPTLTSNTQLETHTDSELALLAAFQLESGSCDMNWDSPTLGPHGLGLAPTNISEFDHGMAGHNWIRNGNPSEAGQSDFAPNLSVSVSEYDSDMASSDCTLLQPEFASLTLDYASWSQFQAAAATASWSTDGIAEADNTRRPSSVKSNNAVLTCHCQRLTGLVSEIQQQLRKLEESPWHTDSACSLDDYPVGTVLELSQQFSTIVGPIFNSTICVDGSLQEGGDGEDKKASSPTADTPTMLLVMCGYIWLVRIYSLVLSHFRKHLNHMPASHHHGTTTGIVSPIGSVGGNTKTAPAGQALRLSELPYSDTPFSLLRIQAVVRMLLEMLHDIENHLGRRGMVACDAAVALLFNFGRHQDDSSNSLGKKATAVKELLREKMGF